MTSPIKLSVSSILLVGLITGCSQHQIKPYYAIEKHQEKNHKAKDKSWSATKKSHKKYTHTSSYHPYSKTKQCYKKVKKPATYKTTTKKVLLQKAITKRVLIRKPHYGWKIKKVKVKPITYSYRFIPAQYKTVKKRVMIKPSYLTWKKGKGLITRIDHTTGEILCRVKIPAVYIDRNQRQLVRPAHKVKKIHPALYKQQKTRKLLSPAQFKTITTPARYTTKKYRVKIKASSYLLKPIDCKTQKNKTYTSHQTYWSKQKYIKGNTHQLKKTIHSKAMMPDNNKYNDKEFLTDRRNISIYGDTLLNRLIVIKLSSMKALQFIPVKGKEVYSVDYVTENKSYITPRGSNFIQLLHRRANGKFKKGKKVNLSFSPRTPNRNNKNGLVLFSGADKPMFALIDSKTDNVVATGGRNVKTINTFKNYDSKWATGHAQWINDKQFLMPDRQSHEISLYRVSKHGGKWQVKKTDSLVTAGSVHTFFGKTIEKNGDIKILSPGEGSDQNNNTDATLYELKISGDKLSLHRQVSVSGGLHHPAVHPNKKIIYAPSSNGYVDIIDRQQFKVISRIRAGKGAGHVVFVAKQNLALIVNHHDTFMTAIDITTHKKIKDFQVAIDNPAHNTLLQSHTGRISPDKKYFYNVATESGVFFRVNLELLKVDKIIYLGGTPKQASQPGELGK
ncbi:MAG: hypothetical protein KAG20_06220 [Cocleimonas sp.]|nr:hypothetical protein [Cocleimonas sp.]